MLRVVPTGCYLCKVAQALQRPPLTCLDIPPSCSCSLSHTAIFLFACEYPTSWTPELPGTRVGNHLRKASSLHLRSEGSSLPSISMLAWPRNWAPADQTEYLHSRVIAWILSNCHPNNHCLALLSSDDMLLSSRSNHMKFTLSFHIFLLKDQTSHTPASLDSFAPSTRVSGTLCNIALWQTSIRRPGCSSPASGTPAMHPAWQLTTLFHVPRQHQSLTTNTRQPSTTGDFCNVAPPLHSQWQAHLGMGALTAALQCCLLREHHHALSYQVLHHNPPPLYGWCTFTQCSSNKLYRHCTSLTWREQLPDGDRPISSMCIPSARIHLIT